MKTMPGVLAAWLVAATASAADADLMKSIGSHKLFEKWEKTERCEPLSIGPVNSEAFESLFKVGKKFELTVVDLNIRRGTVDSLAKDLKSEAAAAFPRAKTKSEFIFAAEEDFLADQLSIWFVMAQIYSQMGDPHGGVERDEYMKLFEGIDELYGGKTTLKECVPLWSDGDASK